MTTAMTPSWYDLLDVDRDATPEAIRTAWKARIADLDPTDRRFRVLNQAAEVLLDPQRRAAYDAELAAQPQDLDEDEPDAPVTPDEEAPVAAPVPGPGVDLAKKPKRPERERNPGEAAPVAAGRFFVPGWLLIAVAALTALVLGVSAWVWFEKPSDAAVADSTRAAQSTAERAVGPILSYNALHLDEDQKAAESYMTSDYRKQYDQLFEVIKQNAPDTKTIVKAQVVASGIVRSGEDRVQVLLFVNRPTTNKQRTTPVVYKDQVTVTMQKVDGEWLVDDMVTSPVSR